VFNGRKKSSLLADGDLVVVQPSQKHALSLLVKCSVVVQPSNNNPVS
jgi:hypothetical protein